VSAETSTTENKPKRALVTGGSGGIGSTICKRLAAQGLHVYVHANQGRERAEKVVDDICTAGGSAQAIVFDVTQQELVQSQLENILQQGPIQVLVNNAGIHSDAPMAGMQPEQWRKVINVSLDGFYNVTQPLLLPMMATRWGRIVNITSVAGVIGNRGQANYAAAKAGVHGATRSLAIELASRGVTVNAVAPGVINSDMIAKSFDEAKIKSLVPMKRAGTVDEVAALVQFLCSDDAGYISGQIIGINGALA